jgi:predicted nucleotidyltransferase
LITNQEISSLTEEIVLATIGSYAAGTANDQSDLDLLVVVKNIEGGKSQMFNKIYRNIWGKFQFQKDIKICTIDEIAEWGNVKNAFLTTVGNTGKLLYEK